MDLTHLEAIFEQEKQQKIEIAQKAMPILEGSGIATIAINELAELRARLAQLETDLSTANKEIEQLRQGCVVPQAETEPVESEPVETQVATRSGETATPSNPERVVRGDVLNLATAYFEDNSDKVINTIDLGDYLTEVLKGDRKAYRHYANSTLKRMLKQGIIDLVEPSSGRRAAKYRLHQEIREHIDLSEFDQLLIEDQPNQESNPLEALI